MKKRQIQLQFPSAGLDRNQAYQAQPPFTTPDALNVRYNDAAKARNRGGSRPGLSRAIATQLGAPSQIRMLATVQAMTTDGITAIADDFAGTSMGSAWTGASWIGTGALPAIFPGNYSDVGFNTPAGAVYQQTSELSTSLPYQIDILVMPYGGQHNGKYQIFGKMNDATPVATTDGFVAELVMQDGTGAFSGTLTKYVGSTPTAFTFSGGTDGSPQTGWFSVLVNGTTVSCYWRGVLQTSQVLMAGVGKRLGFGMNCTVAGGVCLVKTFRIQYQTGTNKQVLKRYLVASSNGSLYKETFVNTMASTGAANIIESDRQIRATERGGLLFIADNSTPRVFGTDGVIDATGKQLSAASVADWTTKSINTATDVVVISTPLGGTIANTVQISSVIAGHVNLATSVLSGTCSYRIERAPKIYDPVADTIKIWQTAVADGIAPALGQVPSGCPLIALYRDRLVLAGQPIAPQAWFMSRQGNYLDFNYAAASTDGGRAVAGASSNAGAIADPLTALITHSDDYLIFGTASSLWILRGDPAYGGQIDNLSKHIGIVGASAWCRTPASEIIFLSRDGIYKLPAGGQGYPEKVSRTRLPQDMLDLDFNTANVSLEYDVRDIGVHIYLSGTTANSRLHYWWDGEGGGLWPMSFGASTLDPNCTLAYLSQTPSESCVLLGCRDGYIRRFRDEQENDDGTAFNSYVLYGPIRLGGDDYSTGLLTELVGMVGQKGGSVAWSVIGGDTGEDISATSTAFKTGTWTRLTLNRKERPRMRAGSMLLKLSNGTTQRWSIEEVIAIIERATQQRTLS